MITTMHGVLLSVGLSPHTATEQEKHLANEVARLQALLSHGECHHDFATLRNVQEQKNRLVATALLLVSDPSESTSAFNRLVADARELQRITTATVIA